MFSTNLIQSNYGDLNIKSLAFDSFKERLQSTMTALTFFISTGQCDCDEIAESNFNYMIAYMSNINYDASKPGAPALSFGNDSNLLIVFYVQIMPDDFVMQLHRF